MTIGWCSSRSMSTTSRHRPASSPTPCWSACSTGESSRYCDTTSATASWCDRTHALVAALIKAVKVRGRVPMLLNFRTADGRTVILSSFVVSLQVERAAGVELFQIIQTTSNTLRVRLQSRAGADPDHVWDEVRAKLVRMLSDHGLSHVAVDRAAEPPELSPGGKFRSVIPSPAAAASAGKTSPADRPRATIRTTGRRGPLEATPSLLNYPCRERPSNTTSRKSTSSPASAPATN
jgi:hypothetical protein